MLEKSKLKPANSFSTLLDSIKKNKKNPQKNPQKTVSHLDHSGR